MSILTITPSAYAHLGAVATIVRWISGLATLVLLIGLMVLFNPLTVGILRAIALIVHPYQNLDQREISRRQEGQSILDNMAKQFEKTQPNQAAELRWLASRD